MGFAMAVSPPSHSASYQSLFPSISSSLQPPFCHTKPLDFSKRRHVYATIQRHDLNDDVSRHRRAILFVGFSFIPFLNLKAKALQNSASDESEHPAREQVLNQIAEVPTHVDASSNPFITLSSGLGIIASGVLGAFYALAQKEKSANIATIESMKTKLAEKEAGTVSMQKSYESKLQKLKEEKNEQIRKSNQEKESLIGQLTSANDTVSRLGKELQKEKKVILELENQIDHLTVGLKKASDDKEELQVQLKDKLFSIDALQERISMLNAEIKDKEDNLANVSSALAVKESEFKKLGSMYEETVADLSGTKLKIEKLKQEILEREKDLEMKSSNIDDLNAKIRSLCDEKDIISRELESYKNEYNELKIYSERQADSDAKLLEDSGKKLEELKEKLELTLTDVAKKEELVNELINERDSLTKTLAVEMGKFKSLENELQVTQKMLEDTRNEAAELTGLLEHSQDTCKNLEKELSKVQAEFSESKTALQESIDSLKQTAEILTNELGSTKDAYVKTKEELNRVLVEIQEISEIRDNSSKELMETYTKLENAINELKEEKQNVASLTKEVNSLKTESLEDKESRKSLASDLEEATKALDEMNQNTKILTRELDTSRIKISGLEDEKEVLYKSLHEQKQAIQEARENMEDAHSMIVKLGKEREHLENKGSKLEKELAAAKGEILRLRNESSDSKPVKKVVKNVAEENAEEVNNSASEDEKAPAVKKKAGRRKKVVSQQKEL
ncbi:hypothetical protein E3N88_39569 [Mikania micrantha]|uniref:MAR-binding filament-like protein 1-1 n=1 Tax=Mikania micrantha TaxID=192012 RepID=A0A5N6LZU1_9ASTR|nr:hypothetical protein E3N88_45447 [Mikania micrantha]KAD2806192.1 hypothetical protein E3N88_39569 [Mikania micrantha]